MFIELTEEQHRNLLVFWNRVPATGPECVGWVELAQKFNNPVQPKCEECVKRKKGEEDAEKKSESKVEK